MLTFVFIAIAGQFGQGASGKAISTRFERMRKEDSWNLAANRGTGGDGAASKPQTPRKRASKAKKAGEEDGEASETETPTKKKGALNKVKGGRVTKKGAGGKGAKNGYVDENDDEEMGGNIKNENGYGKSS